MVYNKLKQLCRNHISRKNPHRNALQNLWQKFFAPFYSFSSVENYRIHDLPHQHFGGDNVKRYAAEPSPLASLAENARLQNGAAGGPRSLTFNFCQTISFWML